MSGNGQPTRVLTWNLWWRFGNWRERLEAVLSVLAEARPDVCGLQEVWADADRNAAGILARELGMQWTWAASPAPGRWQRRLGAEGEGIGIGNAVLSRWPITERADQPLPAGGEPDEGRTVLYAGIAAPTGAIPFFTTQLNSAPHQSAVRCQQAAAVARFVAAHAGDGDHPAVVTGDLNAEPDSDEVRQLGGHKTAPVVPGLVLVDAWRYADPAAAGWTWDARNPYVRATLEPAARIDYVLVGYPGARGRGHVRSVRLVGDRPTGGVWPSDHAGVLAELQP
jgi:endonuclease/exonuclease/phosphatase family metal-dependent hydrolase